MPQTKAKLAELVKSAVVENDCTEIGCTTCGAATFRMRLHRFVAPDAEVEDKVLPFPPRLTAAQAEGLLVDLKVVPDEWVASPAERSAVKLILFLIWSALGGDASLPHMRDRLQQSAAGRILQQMEAHSAADKARRAEHARRNSTEEKVRRKAERAERHAERLRQKAMRDQAWRAKRVKSLDQGEA